GPAKFMAVSKSGLIVASIADARLMDDQLRPKASGPMDNARGVTAAAESDVAVIRCEGPIPSLLVVDVASFTIVTPYFDRKAGKALVLPIGVGKNDPVLTPDGRTLFTQGEGKLQRWTVVNGKLTAQEASKPLGAGEGKIVVSPDGKFVALV